LARRLGRPGITAPQREALIKNIKAATETAEWKSMLEKMGWTPVFISGDAFAKFVDDESKSLGALVDSLGLRK
jgi:putative tricarboxylic transport membrane protein